MICKKLFVVVMVVSILTTGAWAAMPPTGEDAWITPVQQTGEELSQIQAPTSGYTDADLNTITNVVNGEVGGICGTVVLTYADGSQLYTDACMLHRIHARIVDNQVRSSLFPDTVSGCVGTYWSTAYTGTSWNYSSQWEHCRADVESALAGGIYVPSNVFAATCDPYFASYYPGYRLWARVDWNTGWYGGTFYYYMYG